MERQHRALKEIAVRCRDRDEVGIIALSNSDEEVIAPSQPARNGDPGEGCSQAATKDGPPSDGDDYIYKLLRMN